MVCMAKFPLLNGRMSSHFDNTRLELTTHTYVKVLFYSMCSKHIDYGNIFFGVITNEELKKDDAIFCRSTGNIEIIFYQLLVCCDYSL